MNAPPIRPAMRWFAQCGYVMTGSPMCFAVGSHSNNCALDVRHAHRSKRGNQVRGRSALTTEREPANDEPKVVEWIPDTPENVMRAIVTNIEVVEVSERDGDIAPTRGTDDQSLFRTIVCPSPCESSSVETCS